MRILFAGNVGESLPPPHVGIPKRALLLARHMRELGHSVGMFFIYRHEREDDLGAGAQYFFDFSQKPTKVSKAIFVLKKLVSNPVLFCSLLWEYYKAHRFLSRESLVQAAHGVFVDETITAFQPTIILAESAIIRTFMTLQVAKKRGVPVVIDTYAEVHDPSILKLRGGEQHRIEYWTELLHSARLIIAPSHYCAKGPLRFMPKEHVRVIYSGIEFDRYAYTQHNKQNSRTYFSLPENAFCVMAVGMLSPRKGHDHLIKAVVQTGDPSIHVVVCGPGDNTWLKDLSKEVGITERVHFFSNLDEDELISLYKASDLYCDASNTPRACLGMSVTEAMSVGMPIVAYDVGGLPEIVVQDVNGYVVPLDNVEELSGAIKKIKNLSDSERERLIQGGITLAKDLVDIKETSKRMVEALSETLQGRV